MDNSNTPTNTPKSPGETKKKLSLRRRGSESESAKVGGWSGVGVGVGVAIGWDNESATNQGESPKNTKRVKKKRREPDSSDDELDFSTKKIHIRQRTPARKSRKQVDSDDDFEEVSKNIKRRRSAQSTGFKRGLGVGKDDEDDIFEDAGARTSRVIRRKPKNEPRASDVDTDSDDGGYDSMGNASQRGKKKRSQKKKEEEEPVFKWWLTTSQLKEGQKWATLQHQGVLFPPLYTPHGIPVLYDGQEVALTPTQEEYATYFAQYLETDHAKKPVFRKNFWRCWERLLNPKRGVEPHIICDFEKVDFRPIWVHLDAKKEAKKERTKEEKEEEKMERERLAEIYGFAVVDGVKERVGNYRIEPPGLFLGRGLHPKTGMFKVRLTPKDITINIGEGSPIPTPASPYEGEKWGSVVHMDTVSWLATWKENISMSQKYVMLHSSSRLKGEADMKKFEVARRLKGLIDKIRASYTKDLVSTSSEERQFATAMWVIDRLALRVGNEKGEDEADTVGCCSLRVEHIALKGDDEVEFDFLGKDSVRYFNTVKVHPKVFANFKRFTQGKQKGEDIFHLLTPSDLNAHFKSFMEGLSAKVFRTYNASFTLQEELKKVKFRKDETVEEKVQAFNKANREVAILCNHQRSVSKTHDTQMEKIDQTVHDIKAELQEVKRQKRKLRNGPDVEAPVPKRKRSSEEEEKPKPLPKTEEKCEISIQKLNERLKKWEIKQMEKDDLKTVSLTTSKVNYIDPRLTVAWCKRSDVPIDKIFTKSLRQKFVWAMDADPDWEF